MKVLVTGAHGLLGKKVCSFFSEKHEVIAPKKKDLDITDPGQVACFMSEKPDIIVHTAAITDVDLCERDKDLATSVNVEATQNLLRYHKGLFIFISTDFVFDGKKGSYKENDVTNPLSNYAKTKLDAERLVAKSGIPFIIARVAVLYGFDLTKKKFVSWALGQLKNDQPVRAVTDHIRTPTLTDDVAKAILLLAGKGEKGFFHIAGPNSLSPYDMSITICSHFGLDSSLVLPIKASDLPQPAKRPIDSSLDTSKIRSLGISMHCFDDGLDFVEVEI